MCIVFSLADIIKTILVAERGEVHDFHLRVADVADAQQVHRLLNGLDMYYLLVHNCHCLSAAKLHISADIADKQITD